MTREISVTQARAELADLVSRVGYTGERVVLTRHGRPLAVLVPVGDLESLEKRPVEIGFGVLAGEGADEAAVPDKPTEPAKNAPLRIAAEQRRHRGR